MITRFFRLPLIACAGVMLAASTTGMSDISPATSNRQKESDLLIKATKTLNKERQIEYELRMQAAKLAKQLQRQKKIVILFNFYKEAGTLHRYYWITPEHINFVMDCRERFAGIARGFDYDTFDPENFFIAWIVCETQFKPNHIERDCDYGICQMNKNHADLFALINVMRPELRHQRPEQTEKNIAIWHLWLSTRQETCWQIWRRISKRSDVRDIYERLKEAR